MAMGVQGILPRQTDEFWFVYLKSQGIDIGADIGCEGFDLED